jgi:hypothetical protein
LSARRVNRIASIYSRVTIVSARRSVLLAIVMAMTGGLPRSARAYRPFDQTDAGVAETGDVELELGPVGYLHDPTGSTYIPGIILNYGVVSCAGALLRSHQSA